MSGKLTGFSHESIVGGSKRVIALPEPENDGQNSNQICCGQVSSLNLYFFASRITKSVHIGRNT